MGQICLPKHAFVSDVDEIYLHREGELSSVEKWLISNVGFSESELRGIPRASLSHEALALIFQNREDPYLLSITRGMQDKQLARFSKFNLTELGARNMALLNLRWANDEAYFGRMSEYQLMQFEFQRHMRLFQEARAYFVLYNRDDPKIIE